MKKIPLLPPKDMNIWLQAIIVITISVTWLQALFIAPFPGAIDISRATLREDHLFGEQLFQLELYSVLVLVMLTLIALFTSKEKTKTSLLLFLSLSWLFVKAYMLRGPDPMDHDMTSTFVEPIANNATLWYTRLQMLNIALIPVILVLIRIKKRVTESVLQTGTLTLLLSMLLWGVVSINTHFFDMSSFFIALTTIPLWTVPLIPGISLLISRINHSE